VVVVIVDGSITSLNVAVTFAFLQTSVALFVGTVEITVGRVVSHDIKTPPSSSAHPTISTARNRAGNHTFAKMRLTQDIVLSFYEKLLFTERT
jgi:hypothetical protein